MSSDDRTPVTTRVPAYQKELWKDDADELGMSQSEFVRTMVQAGRHELGLAAETAAGSAAAESDSEARAEHGDEVARTRANGSGEVATAAEQTSSSPRGERPLAENGVESDSSVATPRGEPLETRVLDILREREVCSWDELLEAVVSDFEEQLDETMGELIESGPVTYSGRAGGYVLDE